MFFLSLFAPHTARGRIATLHGMLMMTPTEEIHSIYFSRAFPFI